MDFKMQKAIMLAENIDSLIKFVHKQYENKNRTRVEKDKIYQIKLLMEDFKFKIIADELFRINQFSWDEKYTLYLVDGFNKGISIIDEYVKNNYNDLFIFTARLYTIKNLSSPFSKD